MPDDDRTAAKSGRSPHLCAPGTDSGSVSTGSDGAAWRRGYLAITGLVTAVHPLLPAGVRAITYLSISTIALVPLTRMLGTRPRRDRGPWWLLFCGVTILTAGNGLGTLGGVGQQVNAELCMTVGHTALLLAAVIMVLRRGRNDIGGLLDVSVAAIGLGGLLWTAVLFPRLDTLRVTPAAQVSVLVSVLVLVGVLSALARVRSVSDTRLPALDLLLAALACSLTGNVLLALWGGSMISGRPAWIEPFIMAAYICVGAVPLHPSVHELMRPGPAPADRLSVGRLVFLGAALAVSAVVGGIRQVIGLPVDGALLAVGSLLMSPLVMIRVGRLAHERQRAEAALRHQATHDTLTGLPNRAELLTRLRAAVRREQAAGRPAVVLLFCDLNGFKDVNDRLGHLVGDELLTGVTARIRSGLREDDTLGRYGGDEFLILCEDPAQEDAMFRLLDHVDRALVEPFLLAGESVRVSCSIGAVMSDCASAGDDLILRADQAMYRVKQHDRVQTSA